MFSATGGEDTTARYFVVFFFFFPLVKPIASDTFKTREVFSATRENRSWRIKFQFPSCPQVSSGECSSGCWGVVSLLLCAGAQSQANVLKFILFYFFSGPFGKLGTLFSISQYELWYLDTIVLSIGLFFPHSVNIITFGFCFLFFFSGFRFMFPPILHHCYVWSRKVRRFDCAWMDLLHILDLYSSICFLEAAMKCQMSHVTHFFQQKLIMTQLS